MKTLIKSCLFAMLFISTAAFAQKQALSTEANGKIVTPISADVAMDNEIDFTFEALVKFNSIDKYQFVFIKGTGATSRVGLQVANNNGLYALLGNGSNTYGYTAPNTIKTNEWYHLAMVYNGNASENVQRLKLYINGVEQSLTFSGTIPFSAPNNPSNALEIMGGVDGTLDEVRIWDGALTESTITDWKDDEFKTCHPNNSSLKLYWPLNGNANGQYTSPQIDGTVTNGEFVYPSVGLNVSRQCFSNALNMTSSSYISAGDFDQLDNVSSFSVEAWVKFDEVDKYQWVFKKSSSSDKRIGLQVGDNNKLYALVGNGSNSYGYTNDVVITGEWYHLIMIYNGAATGNSNKLQLYLNGDKKNLNYSGTIPVNTASISEPLEFFNDFSGEVDDVRVWSTSLTESSVKVWWDYGLNSRHPKSTDLLVYWTFNNDAALPPVVSGEPKLGTSITGVVSGSASYTLSHEMHDAKLASINEYHLASYVRANLIAATNLLPETFENTSILYYFAATPNSDGTLNFTTPDTQVELNIIKENLSQNNLNPKIIFSIVGNENAYGVPMANATTRATFIDAVLQFCLSNNLDGADIDWEAPRTAANKVNALLMLQEFKAEFASHGLLLTAAIAEWDISYAVIAHSYLDYINIMAYDMGIPHSDINGHKRSVQKFINNGIPKSKLIGGMPFYGWLSDWSSSRGYSNIFNSYGPLSEDTDLAGGYNFNGVTTIKNKVQYNINENLAGSFMWSHMLDLPVIHSKSLMKAMNDVSPVESSIINENSLGSSAESVGLHAQ